MEKARRGIIINKEFSPSFSKCTKNSHDYNTSIPLSAEKNKYTNTTNNTRDYDFDYEYRNRCSPAARQRRGKEMDEFTNENVNMNVNEEEEIEEEEEEERHFHQPIGRGSSTSIKRKRNPISISDRELHDQKKILVEDFEKLNLGLSCLGTNNKQVDRVLEIEKYPDQNKRKDNRDRNVVDTDTVKTFTFGKRSKGTFTCNRKRSKERIADIDIVERNKLISIQSEQTNNGNSLGSGGKASNFYDLQLRLRQKFCRTSSGIFVRKGAVGVEAEVSIEKERNAASPHLLKNTWTFVKPSSIRKRSALALKPSSTKEYHEPSSSIEKFYSEFSIGNEKKNSVLVYDHRGSSSKSSKDMLKKDEEKSNLAIPLPAAYFPVAKSKVQLQEYHNGSQQPISEGLPKQTEVILPHSIRDTYDEEYIEYFDVEEDMGGTTKRSNRRAFYAEQICNGLQDKLERKDFIEAFNSNIEGHFGSDSVEVEKKKILRLKAKKNRGKRRTSSSEREKDRERMIVRALAGCGALSTNLYRNPVDESIDKLIRRTSAKYIRESEEVIAAGVAGREDFYLSQNILNKDVNVGDMNIENIDNFREKGNPAYSIRSTLNEEQNTTSSKSSQKEEVLSLCDAPWKEIEERKALQTYIDYSLIESFSQVSTDGDTSKHMINISREDSNNLSRGSTFRLVPFDPTKVGGAKVRESKKLI